MLILAVVMLGQALDGMTLAFGIHVVGIQAEVNPLARTLYADGGLPTLLLAKAAMALGMIALIALYRGGSRPRYALASLAGGMGVIGAAGNLAAILWH